MKAAIKIFCWVLLLSFAKHAVAQLPSHNFAVGSTTVTDCRAKFYDNGGPSADYISQIPSGSSGTFVINTGNPIITMTFNPSSLQTKIQIGDFITFYKQFPLIPANIIAGPFTNVPITGTLAPVQSTTGLLIVVFTEDGSGGGAGWDAGWYSQAPPPPTPTTTLATVPLCNASVISMTTTAAVLCADLTANYFNVTGPIFPIISTVVPVGPCNNGTTTAYNIVLSAPGLNQNCTYTITSTLFAKDRCDSVYQYPNLISTFSISSCPITGSMNVTATNTVCAYSCTANLSAVVPASVCLALNYTWDNSLPSSPGPHAICPTVTTVYNCTVAVNSTPSNSIVLTRTVYVIDPQITPLATNTICQTNGNFNFSGAPGTGTWSGPGIINAATGLYCPGCVGPGVKTITYSVGQCFATYTIMIIALNPGSADAACLGGPTFTVTGGTPLGGVWSGAGNIAPNGAFTPTLVGSFLVTYSLGSCSGSKSVHVAAGVSVTPNYTVCQSKWYEYIINRPGFSPPGGRFYGPGILNTVIGTFSPALAGPGNHVMTYSLASGCFDTFTVTVLPINVTPITATTCPSFGAFLLSSVPSTATPAGGTWSCSVAGAIQNPSTGMYDPGAGGANTHTDIVVYTAPNGCPDTIIMKSIRTNIVTDSLFFCLTSSALQLSNNFAAFSYSPAGGVYSGPGVTFSAGNYFFTPAVAGVGVHTVSYTVSGCTPDVIKMIVYPNVATLTPSNAVLCSTHPTVALVDPPHPFGTTWIGPGVVTASAGIFNPGSVPPNSTVVITYTNRGGCSNTVSLYVYQYVDADITGLSPTFCYQNTTYTFFTVPPNGTLTAVPQITPNAFNPSVVGAGQYTITYEFGIGACYTSTSVVVKVWPQLTTTASVSNPTICIGESSKLNVKGFGGLPTITNYTYTWSNGLISIPNQNVVPNVTTVYTCVTSDGCSDPKLDTFRVHVHPNYYASFNLPTIQCYGVVSQVTTNLTPAAGPYSYTWSTSPVQNGAVLNGIAGKNYMLSTKNTTTGCKKDTSVVIPGWPVIQALFSPEPNLSCVPFEENNVSFLDLSNGATSGVWTFAGGSQQTYTPGVAVSHEFKDPGSYNVQLDVVNQGNCPSSYAWSICILESTEIFLPDIFSPNNDGSNDILFVRGNGIKEMKFHVYDRWGNKVFESGDVKAGWDGKYNGKDAEPGVYAYYLDVTLYTDKKIVKKGDITLVR